MMNGDILSDFRQTLESKKAVQNNIYDRLDIADEKMEQLRKDQRFAEQAQIILQTVAQKTQQELEYKISELVSLALKSVFDEPYEMRLIYETKRNKTEANIVLERDGEQFHPLTSTGGGVADIISFALRVTLWSLGGKKTQNTFILDEPFKWLSRGILPRAGQMVKEISDKLNLQIIMVSHLEELIDEADKVFKVSQKTGLSKVIEEK